MKISHKICGGVWKKSLAFQMLFLDKKGKTTGFFNEIL